MSTSVSVKVNNIHVEGETTGTHDNARGKRDTCHYTVEYYVFMTDKLMDQIV